MTTNVSNAVKAKIIGDYIKTPSGRAKLAASMTQPLRLRRDYSSVGRKTFLVEELPNGVLPVYDKDPDVTAYVVGEEGENIVAITKPRRVIFPLFEIASNPEIPLTQIKERRYDLIERAQDLARAQIQAAEDERVFAVMDAIAANGFDSVPGGINPDIPVVGQRSRRRLREHRAARPPCCPRVHERQGLRGPPQVRPGHPRHRDPARPAQDGPRRHPLGRADHRQPSRSGRYDLRVLRAGDVRPHPRPYRADRAFGRRSEGPDHRLLGLREYRDRGFQPQGPRPPHHHPLMVRMAA